MKKLTLFLVYALLVFLLIPSKPVLAEQKEEDNSEVHTSVFQLNETSVQTDSYKDSDGNLVEITVEYIPCDTIQGGTVVSNGTYKISSDSNILSLSFYIQIVNTEIVRAYNPSYYSTFATLTNPQLVQLNSKKVTYRINYSSKYETCIKWLNCTINSNNELLISDNY